MSSTATEDFEITASIGDRLKADPPPDGTPGGDGLVAVADRIAIFKAPGEPDLKIGSDGDDDGTNDLVRDMLDSGHGFLVRSIPEPTPKTYRNTCEICDEPLPTPGSDPDWLCQFGNEDQPASLTCNCPWCRTYQDYLAGKYKPKGGRPRQRCGSKRCEAESKRRRRQAAKVKPEPAAPVTTLGVIRPPEQSCKSYDPAAGEPRAWNRPRRRNEPNWHLSCARRRVQKPPN